MADEATPQPAGEQPAAPTPNDLMARLGVAQPAGEQQDAQQPDTDADTDTDADDYKGAGSKGQLKADLATERDKRQQLETQFTTLRDGLARALGLGQDEQLTPEQLTEQLTSAQAERDASNARLQVFLAAPDGVDVKALLDSRSFTDSLKGVDLSAPDAIAQAVGAFVDANPRFRTGSTAPLGARDANAGRTAPNSAVTMDDLIRGRR